MRRRRRGSSGVRAGRAGGGRAGRYRISGPDAIAASRASVWVANGNNNTVTQLSAASGGLIRVISAPGNQLNVPIGLAVAVGRVWMASDGSNLVTEISAATGGLIRVVSGGRTQLARR